jgi:double-strand break repair protein MRE11
VIFQQLFTILKAHYNCRGNVSEITVTPLLFCKGETKLALYGLSAIKDERLFRLFREGKVQMLRPAEDTEEWFNLLTLHQNRVKHGESNYLPEHFIDGFFDLVVWGHEHECRLELVTKLQAGNTKGGSITVPLTSCLIGLD